MRIVQCAGCNAVICGHGTIIGAGGVVRETCQNMEREQATHWRMLLWSAHGSSVGTC